MLQSQHVFFNWEVKQPQPPTERYFPSWPQPRGETWTCHVPGSNFIWTGVEFSDGFGLPPILENTQSCKKMGEDKLVKDFLKIHTPLKTNKLELDFWKRRFLSCKPSFSGSMLFSGVYLLGLYSMLSTLLCWYVKQIRFKDFTPKDQPFQREKFGKQHLWCFNLGKSSHIPPKSN